MARNGSGTYAAPINAWNPALNGVSATAADWQTLLNDLVAAMTQSVSADGQTPITGNLAMGGNKLTGLGAGTGTGQSLRFEQLFDQGTEADLASGATTDIGVQNTNFLQVTGTTTITSFGTTYRGPRFVRFSGALTLTHNATTLILPGAASILTVAGDVAIVVPVATAGTPTGWKVVGYQRAAGMPATAGPLASSGITGAAASGANNDITSLAALSSVPTVVATSISSSAKVKQIIEATPYVTYTSTGVVIPYDDTIPQITEGLEIMTVTITPTNATNRLRLEFNGSFGISSAGSVSVALFQDATAGALAASGATYSRRCPSKP